MPAAAKKVVVIGAGPNGLVAAAYLARAGFAPLVLERRSVVGGIAVNEEIHPGFHCPAVAHSLGPFQPRIIADLELDSHGLSIIYPDIRIYAPNPNGRGIGIYQDPARTVRDIETVSDRDARSFAHFIASFAEIGSAIEPILSLTPPPIDGSERPDLWELGRLGLRFKGLDRKDSFRLLRWGPMAVADLASEWFETEQLRAIVAARGIYGAFAGPWSAGTCANLLLQAALDGRALGTAQFVKGGIGNLTQALAKSATSAGAKIRTDAEVKSISVKGGKVVGVVLTNGEEIPATHVVSNADPKSTFLKLIDPSELNPDFRLKMNNYRSTGSAAKVNLALSALPTFTGVPEGGTHLTGRIHIGPDIDYLERAFDAAKYGDFAEHPYLDITIPSLTDPSLAPNGAHVMSIHVQFAPYRLKSGDWNSRREALGDAVIKTLADYAPNISSLILARQVLTPVDLESKFGLGGGHILHGEPALDQLFLFRPLLGFAQYRGPVSGLYICGSGTHPGGGVTGMPGANASREIIKDLRR